MFRVRDIMQWWKGENICKSRTSINQPLTRRRRGDVQISEYRAWTGTAQGEEHISKEKAVSELSVWLWIFLSLFLLLIMSVCNNSEFSHCHNINKFIYVFIKWWVKNILSPKMPYLNFTKGSGLWFLRNRILILIPGQFNSLHTKVRNWTNENAFLIFLDHLELTVFIMKTSMQFCISSSSGTQNKKVNYIIYL
jgi:hypothetical protein